MEILKQSLKEYLKKFEENSWKIKKENLKKFLEGNLKKIEIVFVEIRGKFCKRIYEGVSKESYQVLFKEFMYHFQRNYYGRFLKQSFGRIYEEIPGWSCEGNFLMNVWRIFVSNRWKNFGRNLRPLIFSGNCWRHFWTKLWKNVWTYSFNSCKIS